MKRTWNKLRPAWLRSWLSLWGPLALLALLPVMSNFLSNRYQVSVQDLLVPVILELLTAVLVALAFYPVFLRNRLAGATGAMFLVLSISAFYDNKLVGVWPVLQALVPSPGGGIQGPLYSLVLLAALGVAGYWVGRAIAALVRLRHWKPQTVLGGVVVAIVITFVLQSIPLVYDLAVEWPQFFYRPPKLAALPASAKSAAKPDIYYIVLDRYASPDVLKSQFNYSDSDFLNFLSSSQYYIHDSAHNNYPYTTMSIASTMDANYLSDVVKKFGGSSEQTLVPFNESIRNSAVASEFKSIGYKYNEIGNWYETSNVSGEADNLYQPEGRLTFLGHDYILNNFSKNILTESPLWRFLQGGIRLGTFKVFAYSNLSDVDLNHYQLQALRQQVAAPNGGRFIFAHILVPHDPYYFNGDGSLSTSTGSDNIGEPVKQKYLGQVQYINSQMKSILTDINRKNDGKAVVVLQSDEGPYPFQLNDQNFDTSSVEDEIAGGDMRKWSDTDLQMKYGNLAAYHLPGANLGQDPAATDAADSVNIFRLVLNTNFGGHLPYLPDCYYAYSNGRAKPETFVDITNRLSTAPESAQCRADGSVKQ